MGRQSFVSAAALAAVLLTPGCGSRDRKAAEAAATAESLFQDGQLATARVLIRRAIAVHDDISDYWLLLARIDVASRDLGDAFESYQNVLMLDRGNVEALQALCQIALAGKAAVRAEAYADQLAVLDPASPLPPAVKAGAALERGDKQTARRLVGEVLAKHPDDLPALMLQSRLLAADEKYADAAKVLEASLGQGGDPRSRLELLRGFYATAGDREGYKRTIARLAGADNTDPTQQLTYADVLYDGGEGEDGYAVVQRVMGMRADDPATAASILDLLLKQGARAMPIASITTDAARASPVMKAVYAQYASETGRPDLALQVLGDDSPQVAPDRVNSDGKAAYAYALGLRGDRRTALMKLNAILAANPAQPRALLARARLRADPAGALKDAREVVAYDERNVAARLTLADLLLRQNERILAQGVLREGMTNGGDPRIAIRLAQLLTDAGRKDEAAAVFTDFARANPISLRAAQLRRTA